MNAYRNVVKAFSFVVAVGATQGTMESARADAPPAAAPSIIRAEVQGIHSKKGKVGCALYSSAKGYPTEPASALKVVWLAIEYNTLTCEFPNLPAGTYAVAVIHDENGNGKMDTNFVGAPTEGHGSSNNVTHTFSPPSWDESKFDVKAASTVTTKIVLHY